MTFLVPSITTDRLLLRKPKPSDAGAIFTNYAADATVTEFLQWSPHKSVADTHAFLADTLTAWHRGTMASWVILEHGAPDVWGMITAIRTDARIEAGYVLAQPKWGLGYMTEALRAVITTCLADPEIWRVGATCALENHASARVMEKAGMQREGILRRWVGRVGGDPEDCYSYATVREA